METGLQGTFVISWAQTELDGQLSAPVGMLRVGMAWRWTGEPVRLDGPPGVLRLGDAAGMADLRRRASHAVRGLSMIVDADTAQLDHTAAGQSPSEQGFTVTNGRQTWDVTLILAGPGKPPLVVFAGDMPPRQTDLWIVSQSIDDHANPAADAPANAIGGVICFTPGTMILTENGPVPVEDITEGHRLQTKDNGCQQVLWIGRRRVSGARLHAMPHLAPVRLNKGALDKGIPDAGLLVSPDHRLVLRGPRARALFNTDEVLVAARDLVNDTTVHFEHGLREVTYIHLLLPSHQIVFANHVETESYYPESAALAVMDPAQRVQLIDLLPDLADDPLSYGAHARRVLKRSEAAILQSRAA